ncbi:MAG: hypothetical protein WBQ50_03700 [Nocardioides sp.]
MRRTTSYVAATLGVVALALSSPVVAEAARSITSGDIRNGTIKSKDIHNQTIKARDIRNNTVRSKDIHDGALTSADFAPGAASVSAYARVIATPAVVSFDAGRTKNFVAVTRLSQGLYCLELAPGVNRVVAVVAAPEGALGNASAQWTGDCGTNGVQIQTERLSVGGAGNLNSSTDNGVSFHVLVP